uniref:Alternative splicing factor SRp20/9G8 n=1 Tax=Cyriopagopus schmidti TaxID=29017 RepID=B5M6D5_CYRSC|nr:alternative splicing factor SRp20/9G8 [Cyriopagopus schmidti]
MKPTSIFVGGLNDSIDKEDLEREFSKFGKLNHVWVARNPPGFAFIEFDDDEDANEAIREMNGATINGSEIRVDMSRNNRGGRRGGFRGGRDGGGGGGYRGGRGFGGRGGGYRSSGPYGSNRSYGSSYGGGRDRNGGSSW